MAQLARALILTEAPEEFESVLQEARPPAWADSAEPTDWQNLIEDTPDAVETTRAKLADLRAAITDVRQHRGVRLFSGIRTQNGLTDFDHVLIELALELDADARDHVLMLDTGPAYRPQSDKPATAPISEVWISATGEQVFAGIGRSAPRGDGLHRQGLRRAADPGSASW